MNREYLSPTLEPVSAILAKEVTPNAWIQFLRLHQERQKKTLDELGFIASDELSQMNGLDALNAALQGRTPVFAMGRTLNFHLIAVETGQASFQGNPNENMFNPFGIVHGGWSASILDSALGAAVYSMLLAGQWFATTDLNVHMVKSVQPQRGPFRAHARVLHKGNQLATAHAELMDFQGNLYAHASASFKILSIA